MIRLLPWLPLLIILALFSAGPKQNFLRIEGINHGELHFPIIYASDSLVAYKINGHLQLSELELLKGSEKSHLFEVVSEKEGGIYGKKVAIDFEILQNNAQTLSLSLTQSSCGMTCAYWMRYYNFNPKNGDRFFLQDFFKPAAYQQFKALISTHRLAALEKRSRRVKSEHRIRLLSYLIPSLEEDRLEDFFIRKDSIFFDWSNLLHKHDYFIDMNHVVGIAKNDFKTLLNDYGQAALIHGQDLESYQALSEPQVYQGEIDHQYSFIWLQRKRYDQSWEAMYAYLQYGRGIYLRGNENGSKNAFWFDEKPGITESSGKITFQIQNGHMQGYWHKEGEEDSLQFEAKRL